MLCHEGTRPTLYRYTLTESFTWRYQYVRIREFTSLRRDVVGEIPCAIPLEIIGYPVRAVLPDFLDDDDCGHNIVDLDLPSRRRRAAAQRETSVLENSYWVKITVWCLATLCIFTWNHLKG